VEKAYRFYAGLYADGALATYSLLEPAELEAERTQAREAWAVLRDPEKRRAYDESHGFPAPEPILHGLDAAAPADPGPASTEDVPPVLTGAHLRRIREARGITLRAIATSSKIGLRFLEYIEEDRFSELPPGPYLRGFLQEYARLVGLNPRRTAEAYMSRIPGRA
jgi:hypothetical protein